MKHRFLLSFLGSALCLTSMGCSMLTWTMVDMVHSDFDTRRKKITRLALLPTDVEINRVSFSGEVERLHWAYPQVNDWTERLLEKIFEEKDCTLLTSPFAKDTLKQNPGLQSAIHTVKRTLYESIQADLGKERKGVSDHTVGHEANLLSDWSEADALVLTRWIAYEETPGETAKTAAKKVLSAAAVSAATGGASLPLSVFAHSPKHNTLDVAIIDGETGNVLWWRSMRTPHDVRDVTDIHKDLKKIMKEFPNAKRAEKEGVVYKYTLKETIHTGFHPNKHK